jgi:hypothetical protein
VAVLGAVVACSAIAIAVTRDGPTPASPETGPASPPVADVPAKPPSLAAPPEQPNPDAGVATRAKDVLARFVAWSRAHRGEPCPEVAALGALSSDPWGHAFRLTCTDQPGDQIIGAISDGADGVPGTADDIASWQLGRDVTDIVRGARWAAAAALPSTPSAPAKAEAVGVGAKPVATRPAAGARLKQSSTIEFDEFGLPKKR